MRSIVLYAVLGIAAWVAEAQTSTRAPERGPAAAASAMPRSASTSQPSGPTRSPPRPSSPIHALKRRAPDYRLEEAPLGEVLDRLAREMNVNLVVNWARLRGEGLNPDTPVTLNVRGLTYEAILRLVMQSVEGSGARLAYRASPEVLLFTTRSEFEQTMIVKRYYVQDIVMEVYMAELDESQGLNSYEATGARSFNARGMPRIPQPWGPAGADIGAAAGPRGGHIRPAVPGGPAGQQYPAKVTELTDVIRNAIEPGSWDVNGGQGTISYFDGWLVVRASPLVHQQLGAVLRTGR